MLFRLSDASLFIDRMRNFRSDVRIRKRYSIFCYDTGIGKCLNPVIPVFAAHNLDRRLNFFFCGNRNGHLFDLIRAKINGFIGKWLADGLQYRRNSRSIRQGSAWCCHTINDHINFSKIFLYAGNDIFFHFF